MVSETGSGKTRKKRRKKKASNIVEIGDAVSHSPATVDPENPAPSAASLLAASQQDHADYKSMLAQVLQDPSGSPPPVSSSNREKIRAEKEKRIREQRKQEKEEAKRREKEEKHSVSTIVWGRRASVMA